MAAEALKSAVEQLEAGWQSKIGSGSAEDVRPYDHRLDRAWSAVETILARHTIFESGAPERVLAAQVHERLFPTGLDFITRPYLEQHAESQRRVALLESGTLREDLEQLVGKGFVDELVAAHLAYGQALNITEASEESSPVSLAAPLRALTEAIYDYLLQVLAFAGHDREHNTAAARRALRPVDVLRRAISRRSARRGGEEVEGDDEALADEMLAEDGEVEGTEVDSEEVAAE